MWTSTNKKFWLFLGIIFIIGLVSGLIYIYLIPAENQEIIKTSITNFFQNLESLHINNIGAHVLVIPLLIISAILIIGVPLAIFYLFYNGFLVGFTISNFTICLGFKGFIYSLIYVLITKLVYLFFLTILITSLIKIGFNMSKIILKRKNTSKDLILFLFKRVIICFIIILLNDIFLLFLGNNLINIFKFLVR